jgi:hypothetical protein
VNLHCDVEFNNMIDPVEKLKLLKKSKSKMPLMIPRRRPHRHTGQEAQETQILLNPSSIIHHFFNMVWLPYHPARAAFFIRPPSYFPRGLWTSCLVIETTQQQFPLNEIGTRCFAQVIRSASTMQTPDRVLVVAY